MESTTAVGSEFPDKDALEPKMATATPARKLIAIVVCVVLFRVYMASIENSSIAHWQHVGAPRWVPFLLCISAVVIGSFTSVVANRWFDRIVAILFAMMFGAGVTLPVSALPGAMLGGMAACVTIVSPLRQFAIAVFRFALRSVVPPFATAMLVGFAYSTRQGRLSDQQLFSLMSALASLLLVLTLVWSGRTSKRANSMTGESANRVQRWLRFVWTAPFGILMLAIGWIVGIELDNLRVQRQLAPACWIILDIRPTGQWMTKGISGVVNHVWIGDTATDHDLAMIRRYDGPYRMNFTVGPEVTAVGTEQLGDLPTDTLQLTRSNDARNGFLAGMRQLRSLGFHESKDVGDQTLSFLTCRSTLENLLLDGSKVTDEGLRHLSSFTSLRKLVLANTNITAAGVAHLPTLPLQTLDLSNTRVNAECIDTLKNTTSLLELNLDGTGIDILSLEPLLTSPNLMVLSLSGSKVGNKEITLLQQFPLRSLTIRGCGIDDSAAARILPNLPYLEIDVWNLSKTTVDNLSKGLVDRSFWVDNKHITKADMERLVSLNHELHFDGCSFDSNAFQYLFDKDHYEPITIYDFECDAILRNKLELEDLVQLRDNH